jgi:aspartate/methionine/tyrosine aminotransferase
MKALVLAKEDLPEGWIGAAVGEPYLVKKNLFSTFSLPDLQIKDTSIFEYTKPQGYDPLVKFLEDKHQAPVIISNGAKQAMGALFYSLKKKGVENIYMSKPWWSLFPPLIAMHNLKHTEDANSDNCAELFVAPNNPDGKLKFDTNLPNSKYCIHDAVYYNKIYMDGAKEIFPVGDVQVFTCSKLFGLSQLRVGYSVFHDTELYNGVIEYMEHMTVGVSILSQMYALNVFNEVHNNPESTWTFETLCREQLLTNRRLVNTIDKSVLTVDPTQDGMFLWAQCHDLNAFDKAKVAVVEGTPFGMPGFIRMNIALPTNQIKEIVRRLNKVEM